MRSIDRLESYLESFKVQNQHGLYSILKIPVVRILFRKFQRVSRILMEYLQNQVRILFRKFQSKSIDKVWVEWTWVRILFRKFQRTIRVMLSCLTVWVRILFRKFQSVQARKVSGTTSWVRILFRKFQSHFVTDITFLWNELESYLESFKVWISPRDEYPGRC